MIGPALKLGAAANQAAGAGAHDEPARGANGKAKPPASAVATMRRRRRLKRRKQRDYHP